MTSRIVLLNSHVRMDSEWCFRLPLPVSPCKGEQEGFPLNKGELEWVGDLRA